MGHTSHPNERECNDWVSDEEDEEQEMEEDPFCPIVKVSKEEKIRMCRPWNVGNIH